MTRRVSIALPTLLVLCLGLTSTVSFAKDKYETISATAFGTGTQVGRLIRVNFVIYQFSTDQDRQVLVDAFKQGQNQGLAAALQKMKAVGHIDVTGTIGYDVNFIRMIPTPTGRKIRFITNRKIGFGEARSQSQTMSYDLTAGEFDINDQQKKKSAGVLYPAAQLIVNDKGELQFELNQNAWRLEAVTDWKGSAEN
jgi:hypothetical protein